MYDDEEARCTASRCTVKFARKGTIGAYWCIVLGLEVYVRSKLTGRAGWGIAESERSERYAGPGSTTTESHLSIWQHWYSVELAKPVLECMTRGESWPQEHSACRLDEMGLTQRGVMEFQRAIVAGEFMEFCDRCRRDG
jgi:hypothetical protein